MTPAPTVDPTFSATDAFGNQLQNISTRAYLTLSPTFVPVPRVTGASVAVGPSTGGTSVVLTGTGFTAANSVQFGGVAASSFAIVNDTTIDAVSPTAPPGTVDVTVNSAGGTSAPSSAAQFTFVGTPTETGISPDHGPVTGGTDIEITGSGFTGTTAVNFGDAPGSFVVNSDTSISATTPGVDAAEPRDVILTGVGGTSTPTPADVFTFSSVGCVGSCVSAGDASVLEGDSGARTLVFPVTLSQPGTANVTVRYDVTGVTATGGTAPGAGVDFKVKSGTLTFATGTSGLTAALKTVSVTVYGDTEGEGDETFAITLSNPTGAYVLGRSSGTGTIFNDDGIVAGPTAGIGDVSIVQIGGGAASMVLPVTLSSPASGTVTISYVVTPDTASYSSTAAGGGAYGGKVSGTISFASGTFAKTISIPIWANANPSSDQSFFVTLTGLTGGGVTIVRDTATGTILGL